MNSLRTNRNAGMKKLSISITLFMFSLNFCHANLDAKYFGVWVAWIPSQNSSEGQYRQAININDEFFKMGRLFAQIKDNKITGAAIPETTYSTVVLSKVQEFNGYTTCKCVVREKEYVMIFREDEMSLIDVDSKMIINHFKKQNIASPQFKQFLTDTVDAANSIEALYLK